jgi:hypothetical protein
MVSAKATDFEFLVSLDGQYSTLCYILNDFEKTVWWEFFSEDLGNFMLMIFYFYFFLNFSIRNIEL